MGYTNMLFTSILLTQSSSGSSDEGQKSPEEVTHDVAEANLKKLPPAFDMELAELKYPIMWEQSMNTVLVQELLRYNKLTEVIKTSLQNTMDGMKGKIVLSEQLEKVGNSLFYGRIPQLWAENSYPSLKPLAGYVNDLLERLSFFQKWLDTQAPPAFWFPGLYFSAAFLTGNLQNFARKYTVPIDHVEFDFVMMDDSFEKYTLPPDDGCYAYGLFIDGAMEWGEKSLDSSLPKVLFAEAPVIYLKPSEDTKLSEYHIILVLFTTQARGVEFCRRQDIQQTCYVY